MCGEFAGEARATALLFGMGLDAFSMSAISVAKVKKNIMAMDKASAEALVERVMSMSTTEDVLAEVDKFNDQLLG